METGTLGMCDPVTDDLIELIDGDADMRDTEAQGADFSGAKLPGRFAEALAASA